MNVSEQHQDSYQQFSEQFGSMANNIRYSISQVNSTLMNSPLENVNIESVMFQCFLASATKANQLQQKIDMLTKLCEDNGIEIPDRRR